MNIESWIGIIVSLLAIGSSVGGVMTWIVSHRVTAENKAYAAKRDFEEIMKNIEDIKREQQILHRALDDKCDHLDLEVTRLSSSVNAAIINLTGRSIDAIYEKFDEERNT
ncbi:MAG: hypothetical protein SAL07_25515 [Oscillatoria sp. PMC 1051.18]|nr:hypothetical protein [Oscillatoria sp. PMC 1050.18]MEC5033267.1 hypothetical protein [Oscillatoria sp. PMC 1051.18]